MPLGKWSRFSLAGLLVAVTLAATFLMWMRVVTRHRSQSSVISVLGATDPLVDFLCPDHGGQWSSVKVVAASKAAVTDRPGLRISRYDRLVDLRQVNQRKSSGRQRGVSFRDRVTVKLLRDIGQRRATIGLPWLAEVVEFRQAQSATGAVISCVIQLVETPTYYAIEVDLSQIKPGESATIVLEGILQASGPSGVMKLDGRYEIDRLTVWGMLPEDRSFGSCRLMKEVEDPRSSFAMVASRYQIDAADVSLIGWSMDRVAHGTVLEFRWGPKWLIDKVGPPRK